MVHHLLTVVSFVLVLLKATQEEVLRLWADVRPFFVFEGDIILTDGSENLALIISGEGWLTRKHGIDDDASTPNVNFITIFLILYYFRGHILGAAHGLRKLVPVIEICGKTEICQFNCYLIVACAFDDDVLRFYITMYNLFLMKVAQ